MRIHGDFVGGNIRVLREDGEHIYLNNELRDTQGDWFYWAFCVEGAEGKTITFHFPPIRLGYYGPAVSHDLKTWHWLRDEQMKIDSFTYTFGADEERVYFAHNMLYHPERFLDFAKSEGLQVEEFCKSQKGRSLPCVRMGDGEISIILTARHHACEGTGSYVLEGVLDELLRNPIPNTHILCVPFVDYDGVVDGDQGKGRAPYDHNRDYRKEEPQIYHAVREIMAYAEEYGCHYGFDFHSPWHWGTPDDMCFIVQNSFEKLDELNAFGIMLEEESQDGFRYFHEYDFPFGQAWNKRGPCFSHFMNARPENRLAFSLETSYFGTPDNQVTQEGLVTLGRNFARALTRYIEKRK
jgi:hypothetical protein